MRRFNTIRHWLAALLIVGSIAAPVRAQMERETFTNLKVLPKDIEPEKLRGMMSGFTRALGVRCIYCHVGQEGQPFKHGDFALDDKPTKLKARVMIQMMQDLNEKYLPSLATRSAPAVGVQCVTCHRGAAVPRMLQDVLKATYESEGIDSTLADYQQLRGKYYGRFTYDFGEVPLADLGNQLRFSGHSADGERLLALNVDVNPKSMFAQRAYANAAIGEAFGARGDSAGVTAYREMKARFGPAIVGEAMLNDIGYTLISQKQLGPSVAAFKLNVDEHPASGDAYDSLGEGYMTQGNTRLAIAAYTKSLALDPTNDNAKSMLLKLKANPKKSKPKK